VLDESHQERELDPAGLARQVDLGLPEVDAGLAMLAKRVAVVEGQPTPGAEEVLLRTTVGNLRILRLK
jgi:hypothetical protein